jgi:hypothetical protein
MLDEILHRVDRGKCMDIVDLFPYHLATAFLDGSTNCCNIFYALMWEHKLENYIIRLYINDKGHTVLDNLMITILKSHTSCPPVTVDDVFKNFAAIPRRRGRNLWKM